MNIRARLLSIMFVCASVLCFGATSAVAQENGDEVEEEQTEETDTDTDTADSSAIGNEAQFGIGLGGGTLTSGISMRYYLGESSAVQGTVGTFGPGGISVNADYIQELGSIADFGFSELLWHVGAGVGTAVYTGNTAFGGSGIIGLGLHLYEIPLEISWEYRPTMLFGAGVISGLYLGGTGGSIRWYF